MKDKNGFISMSLVYSFLIVFLFLMMAIINCYLKKNTYLEALNEQVSKDIGITRNAKASVLTTILEENVAMQTTTINFSKISNNTSKNGNGLYYIESTEMTDENNDGYGAKIYFFRGAVNNNNVVFGSKITRNGSGKVDSTKDLCWKIIRTNEDGSIRLIYNGEKSGSSCPGTTPYITSSVFNENSDSNAYVGYTYGQPGNKNSAKSDNEKYLEEHYHTDSGEVFNSKIKQVLDNYFLNSTLFYYSTELNYEPASSSVTVKMRDKSIKNAIYCADRTIYDPLSPRIMTGGLINSLGYSISETQYAASNFVNNPTFMCDQSIDKYTLRVISGGTNENLNALTYGIGLPTMADVVFAGGSISANNTGYYLRTTDAYWTMTPYQFDELNGAQVAAVDGNGKILPKTVTSSLKVRPVISIDQKTLVLRGSGLENDPYILE